MKQYNTFTGGLISDLDYSKIPSSKWVIPASNIRIFNDDGQGFICTDTPGNHKITTLEKGYVVIGACVVNGISFIASVYNSTTKSPYCQIGVYPAPRSYNIVGGNVITNSAEGFIAERYMPLVNFTGTYDATNDSPVLDAVRMQFKTPLLNFNKRNQIEMFGRVDYDDSITLFLTDYNEPIKCINSGIKLNGTLNNRTYWNGSFPNKTNLIPGHEGLINIQLNKIDIPGNLKYGNYIYFLRYLDESLTPTGIVAESRACQVYDGQSWEASTVQGGHGNSYSDKSIQLKLENIDQGYKYVELLYIRYYSDDTNNLLVEEGLLNEPFLITGNDMLIQHFNHDNDKLVDINEIFKQNGYFNVCKSITHAYNTFYGANWKGSNRHDDSLIEFFRLIKVDITLLERDVTPGNEINQDINLKNQYKDYKDTYDYIGYFRGETYPFAGVAVFKDGYRSLAYTVRGIDAYDVNPVDIGGEYIDPTKVNEKGIFRFPSREKCNLYKTDNKVYLLGIKFDTAEALNYLLTDPDATWINDNVASIFFVRGERNPNLQYQGLTFNLCGERSPYLYLNVNENKERYKGIYGLPEGAEHHYVQGGYDYVGFTGALGPQHSDIHRENVLIPFFNRNYPVLRWNGASYNFGYNTLIPIPNQYAFYSHDFIKEDDITNIHFLQELGKVIFDINDAETVSTQNPTLIKARQRYVREIGFDGSYPIGGPFIEDWLRKSETLNSSSLVKVPRYIYPSNPINLKYVSASRDALSLNSYPNISMLYTTFGSNDKSIRDSVAEKYLAISTNNPKESTYVNYHSNASRRSDYNFSMINLYKTDPHTIDNTNIVDVYFNNNIPYYQITDVIDLTALGNEVKAWGGDCFVQMTFIKQMGSYLSYLVTSSNGQDMHNVESLQDSAQVFYGHGVILGLVTENKYNWAMRHNTAIDIYYPKQPDAQVHTRTSRYNMNGAEEWHLNIGYSKTLSPRLYNLYDAKLPLYVTKKPTMIRYSPKHIPYSFVDYYRLLDVASYKDFDLKYGEIVKIGFYKGYLFSVQNEIISQHFIGQRKLLDDPDNISAQTILGDSSLLGEQQKIIADFGSQHQWSIVESDIAVYGVDLRKGVIWQLSSYTTTTGGGGLGAKDLLLETMNKKIIRDIQSTVFAQTYSDASFEYPDSPSNYNGILSGFDRKNGEILFSFIFRGDRNRPLTYKTLVYSEKLKMFTCYYDFCPNFYLTINEDFYSFKEDNTYYDLYLHNDMATLLNFYGNNVDAAISIIVNGIINAESNMSVITKQYDALELESQRTAFAKILYETIFQSADHDPFSVPADYWKEPIYQEGKWRLPIIKADAVTSPDYLVGSQMRGEYLKITVQFSAKAKMLLKSIGTIFKISHT